MGFSFLWYYWTPLATATRRWTIPGTHRRLGGVFILDVGAIILGIVLLFVYRAMRPAFFRGEVLNADTPTRVPEDIGEPVGLFGIEPFDGVQPHEGGPPSADEAEAREPEEPLAQETSREGARPAVASPISAVARRSPAEEGRCDGAETGRDGRPRHGGEQRDRRGHGGRPGRRGGPRGAGGPSARPARGPGRADRAARTGPWSSKPTSPTPTRPGGPSRPPWPSWAGSTRWSTTPASCCSAPSSARRSRSGSAWSQLNLLGLLYCTHAALPHLLRRGRGRAALAWPTW